MSIIFLSQALNHILDASPQMTSWYDRLIQYKKKGLVRMGLCRKSFTQIYQMLKKEEYNYCMDPMNHKMKIEKYLAFLKQNGIIVTENFSKIAS